MKLHVQAGVMVARPWAFETIVMAIVLEQQKQLERLERRVGELLRRGQTSRRRTLFQKNTDPLG